MLRYCICTLLIILIVTIVLSYSYNEEAFTDITAASAMAGAGATGAPAGGAGAGGAGAGAVGAGGAPPVIITNPKKADTSVTNTDNQIVRDRINIATEYTDNFFRIFAAMPSLNSTQSVKYRLMSEDGIVLTNNLTVTNDIRYESASLPLSKMKPYFNTTAYILPKGVNSINDAYASFMIPPPKGGTPMPPVAPPAPEVDNPEVILSETGFDAMKLNKQSNLLNDIQKIVHNEMLIHRATDASVKNPSKKKRANRNASNASNRNASNASNASNDSNRNASCAQDEMGDEMGEEIETQDMSKYIKKDEIPCWGCSLDY